MEVAMSVPKMLRERVLNSQGSEALVCSSIAQVARKPEYAVEEAFEILVMALHSDVRVHVHLAAMEGIADVVARTRHANTLAMQMARLLTTRNGKNARILSQLIATRNAPQLLRLKALDLFSTYSEADIGSVIVGQIEDLLRAQANASASTDCCGRTRARSARTRCSGREGKS
jgi:hypothetical protein